MRRITGYRRGALAGAVVLIASIVAIPAVAAQTTSLDVVSVDGRTVSMIMTFDPLTDLPADTPVRATVDVAGRILPADATLEVDYARPTSAMVVLDTSGSMSGPKIIAARTAATSFVESVPADAQVGLVTFSTVARLLSSPTTDHKAVVGQIASVNPGGYTALYDAVQLALDTVPPGQDGRIIVLSDGTDSASTASLEEAAAAAKAAGVPIDVVAIKPTTKQLEDLRQLSGASGGTLVATNSTPELLAAFAEASKSFGARVQLTADIPVDVDASGADIIATVIVGDRTLEATTALPINSSLNSQVQQTAVALPVAPTVEQPPTLDWLPLAVGVAVGMSVALIAWLMIQSRQDGKARRRVRQVLRYKTGGQGGSLSMDDEPDDSWLGRLDAFLSKGRGYRKTAAALGAAGLSLTPARWLVMRLAVVLILSLSLSVVFGSIVAGCIVGILVGWLLTAMILRSRVSARRKAFASELPDYLMLLASGLRAGMSFAHALESSTSQKSGEVGTQMQRVLQQVQVGGQLDDALMDCAERMDNDDLRWTVTALSIQREVGGSLSTILDNAAATIKSRYELRREVTALSTEGRLSGYILIALPIGVFIFLYFFRREYVATLWTEPMGIALLITFAALITVGWFWMSATVRIKV